MRTYFSAGVSTLVAIMAAHRIAAHEVTTTSTKLQTEINRIDVVLVAHAGEKLRPMTMTEAATI
jgi:hypothetical protein